MRVKRIERGIEKEDENEREERRAKIRINKIKYEEKNG